MKKTILLISFTIISFFLSLDLRAEGADSSNVKSKTNEIITLLTSKLGLTQNQIPAVQGLVSEFAGKFAKTNPKSSGGGLKAKLEKDEQNGLVKEFSDKLPTLLNATQSTKFASIKDQISTLFTQIK